MDSEKLPDPSGEGESTQPEAGDPKQHPALDPLALDVAKFSQAVAALGLLGDERWETIFEPILLKHREAAARVSLTVEKSLDGAVQAMYWHGERAMAQRILNYFRAVRSRAATTVKEVARTRPV